MNDCVSFGVTDKNWGERSISAVIRTLKGKDSIDCKAYLLDYLSKKLSPYKVPRDIIFLESFQKNRSGKPDSVRIREDYLGLGGGLNLNHKKSIEGLKDQVMKLASEKFWVSQSELSLDDLSQNTPGWDSMAHLDLILGIEESFGIEITGPKAVKIKKLNDLVSMIEEKRDSLS